MPVRALKSCKGSYHLRPASFVLQDPDYAPRLAGFAAYKASIYARYPLACERCAPLIEEEIRKKDDMARSNALGSWLNESKKKDTRRQRVALSSMDRHKLSRELRWWTARGALWVATLFVAVSADVAGASSARFSLSARVDFPLAISRRHGSSDVTRMGLTCSITPDSDPLLHTLDGLVAHLCTFSESRAPGPESAHAWQGTIHCKHILLEETHRPSAHSASSHRYYRPQCGRGECSPQV